MKIKIMPLFPKDIRHKSSFNKNISFNQLEKEQPGQKDIDCPVCNAPCWISAAKINYIKEHNMELMCWDCVTELMAMNEPDNIKIQEMK